MLQPSEDACVVRLLRSVCRGPVVNFNLLISRDPELGYVTNCLITWKGETVYWMECLTPGQKVPGLIPDVCSLSEGDST